jgi:hypothetical protein
VVDCEVLGMEDNFQSTCFGHAFSKACQYGTIEKKFVKIWNIYLVSQPNFIYKSAWFGQRNMEKGNMNGIKFALILEFD